MEGTGGIFCCLVIVIVAILAAIWHDSETKAKAKAAEKEREAEQRATEAQERAVEQQRLAEPSGYGAELDARLRAGDEAAVLLLLSRLPGWPIRGALEQATRRLMAFWHGAHLAATGSAVFGPAATAELTAIITATGNFIRHVALKLMTLSRQAGPAWNRLPAPARQYIERDHSILNRICTNLDHAQHNVTIAIADGRHANARAESDVIQALQALSQTLREMSGPYT